MKQQGARHLNYVRNNVRKIRMQKDSIWNYTLAYNKSFQLVDEFIDDFILF